MRKRSESKERRHLLEQHELDHHDHEHEPSDLRGDYGNIAILFILYLLQGIPIGLTAAIPMLIQNRGANYKQQAEFSFAHWPFSLKLLWAPIVDSLYFSRIGRRKSWMVPTQYLIGIFMLILSRYVNIWLGNGDDDLPHVPILTTIFFCLNFLASTQDISVDGWALTMLKRCNVGYASTCNSVGQTAGYFLGYVAFMALESKEFCNTYLRKVPEDEGLVTLSGFLHFWGIVFLVTTTLVAIFKREHVDTENHQVDHPEYNIKESYSLLVKILKMKPILLLMAVLLTVKIGFAACDSVTTLKLIDLGIPKDKLALLAVPLVPLQIVLPLIISKYTVGKYPMSVYLKAIPYRLVLTIFISGFVYATPIVLSGRDKGDIPYYYYVILLTIYGLYQITLYSMFVAVMAFFAKISDPRCGGTYMTLLNTLSNLGGNWPTTFILWLVDVITWKSCIIEENPALNITSTINFENNTCVNSHEVEECHKLGAKCRIDFDGYYLECVLCLIYGLIWYKWGKSKINYLQRLPTRAWHVIFKSKNKS